MLPARQCWPTVIALGRELLREKRHIAGVFKRKELGPQSRLKPQSLPGRYEDSEVL